MASIRTFRLAAALLVLTLGSAFTYCQETITESNATSHTDPPGTLWGHKFILSSSTTDPFVRTFLNTTMGGGITPDLSLPILEIGGKEIYSARGSLLFTTLAAEYRHMIRDWIAVGGRVAVIGRLADETGALLAQGVTLLSGFDFGWQFRCLQKERLYVSAFVGGSSSDLTDVDLQRFIAGVIDEGTVTPQNKLAKTTPVLRGTTSLEGAYALSEAVGLIVSGDLSYGQSANKQRPDQWYYRIGAAVDVDLAKLTETPIGFAAGLHTGSMNTLDLVSRAAYEFSGYMGYTGSSDFALGLNFRYYHVPVQNLDSNQAFVALTVDIRLFF